MFQSLNYLKFNISLKHIKIWSQENQLKVPHAETAPKPKLAVVEGPEAFWTALLQQVSERRPLNLHWLQVGTLQGIDKGRVKVGFPKSETPSRDSLMRDRTRDFLEEVASELLGMPATFDMVIDSSLSEPDVSEMTLGFIESIDAAPAVDEPAEEAAPEEADDSGLDPAFYDDPVVKRAVERFKLKLIPSGDDAAAS